MNVRAATEPVAVRRRVGVSLKDGSVMATMTAATIQTKTASIAVNNMLYIINRAINASISCASIHQICGRCCVANLACDSLEYRKVLIVLFIRFAVGN